MKLLLDQGLPRSTARLLSAAGTDTIHVGDIGYAAAEDAAILQRGRDEGRTIVTLYADFHTLLALSRASGPSAIRIRIEGLRADAVVNIVHIVLSQYTIELEQGAVVTVQEGRLRLRNLPLLPVND